MHYWQIMLLSVAAAAATGIFINRDENFPYFSSMQEDLFRLSTNCEREKALQIKLT